MATITFKGSQCFVLCDQSEEFMRRHRSLKKLISVTSVQLHDKLSGERKTNGDHHARTGRCLAPLRMARCFSCGTARTAKGSIVSTARTSALLATMRRERTRKGVTTFVLGPIMSVVETIHGLRKMGLADDD